MGKLAGHMPPLTNERPKEKEKTDTCIIFNVYKFNSPYCNVYLEYIRRYINCLNSHIHVHVRNDDKCHLPRATSFRGAKFEINGKGNNEGVDNKNRTAKSVNILICCKFLKVISHGFIVIYC